MTPTFAVEPRAAERMDHFKPRPCDVVRIEGVTSVDPHILLRVLQRVLVNGGTPVAVNFHHRSASNRFSLQVTGLPGNERLVATLGAIVGVRAVRGGAGEPNAPLAISRPPSYVRPHHD